jgi:DtxR family Mn-dependent transcriptional regulator
MGVVIVLSASLEDYLKAIYHIVSRKQAARAKDISERLGVKNSSVTGALRILADRGLVNHVPYDVITLTAEGRRISEDVVRRHNALRNFFVDVLLLKTDVADRVACTMEHGLSAEVLDRLTRFVKYLKQRPDCLERFHDEWPGAAAAFRGKTSVSEGGGEGHAKV